MTNPGQLDKLPDEILLQILAFLEPHYLPKLRLVCTKLRDVCSDRKLWKRHCFERSTWYHFLQTRRRIQASSPILDLDRPSSNAAVDDMIEDSIEGCTNPSVREDNSRPNSREHMRFIQDMANWDPTFPEEKEKVSWYDEYVQRHGPASINWLEVPKVKDGSLLHPIEARGVALFNPNNGMDGLGSLLAVSPLDDGSVCLWDVNGNRKKQGGIVAKSSPEILLGDKDCNNKARRSKRVDSGVTDCVSINHSGHRAFFAVQSHLVEVDLNRLEVVSRESFEWSITTLSPVHENVPLTVGTSLGIHLHDFRARAQVPHDVVDKVDERGWDDNSPFKHIFDPKPLPPYASLSQPTPTSILHLPLAGRSEVVSDDIYVAGRFSNIIHYDRRKFPRIVGSIFSGADLTSLAALPYPYSTVEYEVRRRGEFSIKQVDESKLKNGRTLIAGGLYKTKGSLELYGLSSASHSNSDVTLQNSTLKNRYKAASSSILSVANHGTKIVCSDGGGLIKWFERDGYTECRRIRIGHSETQTQSSLFASMPGSDDMARKVISTKLSEEPENQKPNNDNILFWTGEKLGMVSFTGEPLFTAEDFEDANPDDTRDDEQRRQYSERLREALEKQADEVRFVKNLGLSRAT